MSRYDQILLFSPEAKLAPFRGSCISSTIDFWHYDLCSGSRVVSGPQSHDGHAVVKTWILNHQKWRDIFNRYPIES